MHNRFHWVSSQEYDKYFWEMFHLDFQVCVDERIATVCPWCNKKMKNKCHCLVFFQTCTILMGRVTLILVYVCLALRVSTAENGERVVWLVISVCSASLLLDVLSAPHPDEWPCLLIEPHWATGESFKQNLSCMEAASPLMRDHYRCTLSCLVQSEAAFPPQRQTNGRCAVGSMRGLEGG